MKVLKKVLAIILCLNIIFAFVACGGGDNVIYNVSIGTKIEELSKKQQQKIDNYVEDCKIIYTNTYKNACESFESTEYAYIAFTEVFIYDFSNVDSQNLSGMDVSLWKFIKELNANEEEPLMYIELQGYCNHMLSGTRIVPINQNGYMYGFFIYESNKAIPLNYDIIIKAMYNFNMVSGTEIVNCGNKYAEEKLTEEIKNYKEQQKVLKIYEE